MIYGEYSTKQNITPFQQLLIIKNGDKMYDMKFYHSLRFKFMLVLTLMVIIPSVITGGLILNELKKKTEKQSQRILSHEFKQAVTRFDEILFEIESYSPTVFSDREITAMTKLIKPDLKDYEFLRISNSIRSALFNKKLGNNYLSSIELVVASTGNRLSSDHQRVMIHPDGKPEFNRWLSSKDDDGFVYLSLNKEVRDFDSNTFLGHLTFNVVTEFLRDRLNEYISQEYSIFVYTDRGELVLSLRADFLPPSASALSAIAEEPNRFIPINLRGREYFGFLHESPHSQLRFFAIVPQEQLFRELRYFWNFTLLTLVIVILITVSGTMIGNRTIIRELNALYDGIHRFGLGELTYSIPTKRNDEIGYIITKANEMAKKIDVLISENYRKEIVRKELQLKTFQIEINEHFLYNTLDLVRWMCDEKKTEEASEIIDRLSSYFRYSLYNGLDVIPIASVIKSLESYSHILHLRFERRFIIEIEADENILKYKVLKYLFQPVLENAVLHGVEPLSRGGKVHLEFSLEKDAIRFSCRDNGVGIEDDRIKNLQKELQLIKPDTNLMNYGLHNIAAQLKLHYGDSAEIRIDSTQGEGTEVTIRIPIISPEPKETE